MDEDKRCCAVIVTYNIGKQLAKCFYSIIDQVDKVIIVDNGSNKETTDYLEKLEDRYNIKIIYNKDNYGIAIALNQGIKYAKKGGYEWILTMDNDSEATKNMVDVMFKTYEDINDLEICSIFPMYIEKGVNNHYKNEKSTYDKKYEEIIDDVTIGMTSGNLVKSEVFDEVGYFKEEFFIDCVDHEFCFRLKLKDKKMIKVEGAKLLHSLGNSIEKSIFGKKTIATNHSSLRRYYMTRNRMYMWKKYPELVSAMNLDKKNFKRENLKILLFENQKISKFKMIWKGYRDFKKDNFGKYKE